MQLNFDWKFGITLLAMLAAVVVPIWLWRADLQAHSINIQIASQTPLEPEMPASLPKLRLSVDGQEVEHPYLTVLTLANNGSRPILPGDFEESLEIQTDDKTTIVRTQVTGVVPKDIQPKTSSAPRRLGIEPLLLNPGDAITLAIVTSGGRPSFAARSRIAGISAIIIENGTENPPIYDRAWFRGALVFCLMITYMMESTGAIMGRRFPIHRGILLIAAISSCLASIAILRTFLSPLDFTSWQMNGLVLGALLTALLVGVMLNRAPRS